MKNPMIVVGIVLLVLLIAIGGYTFSQKKFQETAMMKNEGSKMDQGDDAMTNESETTMVKDDKSMVEDHGTYTPYSSAVLSEAVSTKRVFFFYANWCPTCRPADQAFSSGVSKIPSGVSLIRVNYNDTDTDQEEKDLAKKYGVTYQHTFVQIDASGNKVTTWNGGQLAELTSNIK